MTKQLEGTKSPMKKGVLRRVFGVLVVLLVASAVLVGAGSADTGNVDLWDGTYDTSWYTGHESDQEYTLTTAEQLAGLVDLVGGKYSKDVEENAQGTGKKQFAGKTIKLGADIDLAGIEWIPIGVRAIDDDRSINIGSSGFRGTFDGQGYTIYNLKITDENVGLQSTGGKINVGFFSTIGPGCIKNVTFDKPVFKILKDHHDTTNPKDIQVGVVVGTYSNVASYVDNVHVTNLDWDVYADISGGIIGIGLNVNNCSVSGTANVGVESWFGGIAGTMRQITGEVEDFKNNRFSGTITGKNTYAGYLIGSAPFFNSGDNYRAINISGCSYSGSSGLTSDKVYANKRYDAYIMRDDGTEIFGNLTLVLDAAVDNDIVKIKVGTGNAASGYGDVEITGKALTIVGEGEVPINIIAGAGSSITITGGSFDGTLAGKDGGTITVSGGSFSADPSAYVIEGYASFEDPQNSGSWIIGHSVTYADGFGTPIQVHYVKHGEAAPEFTGEVPTRTNFTFNGWDKEASPTVEINEIYNATWIHADEPIEPEMPGVSKTGETTKIEAGSTGTTITVPEDNKNTAVITDPSTDTKITVTFSADQINTGSVNSVEGTVVSVQVSYAEALAGSDSGTSGSTTYKLDLYMTNLTEGLPIIDPTYDETKAKGEAAKLGNYYIPFAMINASVPSSSSVTLDDINKNLTKDGKGVKLTFSIPEEFVEKYGKEKFYVLHFKDGEVPKKLIPTWNGPTDGKWELTVSGDGFSGYIVVVDTYVAKESSSSSSSSGSSVWLSEPATEQPTPTQTPTETATPTDTVPTDIPSTQPTATPASPGFGILATLAGLGAVAVLRRQ